MSHVHAASCLSDARCWTQRRPSAGAIRSECLVPPGQALIKAVENKGEGLIECPQSPPYSPCNRRLYTLERHFDVTKEIHMKRYRQGNPRPAKRPAKKPTNVFHANLLTPDGLEFATRESPSEEREALRGQWPLDGTVSRKVYAGLCGNFPFDLAPALIILPTPTGAAYVD